MITGLFVPYAVWAKPRFAAWQRRLGFLAILLGLSACTTAKGLPTPTVEPPAGAFKAEVGFPAPGTRWTTRSTYADGRSELTRSAVTSGMYGGRPVYIVAKEPEKTGNRQLDMYDKATANRMAGFLFGNEMERLTPHQGTFSWPLWIGKSWTAEYVYSVGWPQPVSTAVRVIWRVEAFEEVTVPAGRFEAFRLKGEAKLPRAGTIVHWYAPQIKLVVKTETFFKEGLFKERRDTEILIDYSPG